MASLFLVQGLSVPASVMSGWAVFLGFQLWTESVATFSLGTVIDVLPGMSLMGRSPHRWLELGGHVMGPTTEAPQT